MLKHIKEYVGNVCQTYINTSSTRQVSIQLNNKEKVKGPNDQQVLHKK